MSEKKNQGVVLDESGKPSETIAYSQWKSYWERFIIPAGVIEALNERRRFFRGDQYARQYAKNAPKPTLNLCQEAVYKIAGKLCGTERHFSFVADKDDEDLAKLDSFYEYQLEKMGRKRTVCDVTMVGLIDGTGVVFTAFDADTIGTEGLYKGFLKDRVTPFEDCFWSNPWTDDPQEMRYCGYRIEMEISAVKALIEGDKATRRKKERYVAKENFFSAQPPYEFDKVTDSDLTWVYVRFFRKNGETYFELATQYVTLTDHPHALNPAVTEAVLKDAEGNHNEGRVVKDYDTDDAQYTISTEAQRETHEGHVRAKRKFSRFPVHVCIPYGESPRKCILGRSLVAMIIPNQKLYNYCYLLVTLIMQYHAMPKWIAKPGALGNQTIDNSPNQVIIDYTKIQDVGGNGFGLTRMASGEAINSNLIDIGDTIAANTRFIFGFANLEATGTSIDSGYEYAQRMKQVNLPLEIPQQNVWHFCAEMARTDLMYFTHYIDKASFYSIKSEAEQALNEDYRRLEQDMIDSGKSVLPKGTQLRKTRRFEMQTIDRSFFDDEFDVAIEVEQGIAGSELTESQHYNQIWTYVAQGNLTADKIRMLVSGDPAISRKTKAKISAALEQLEVSQLAMKDQQIQALQQAIQELQGYMRFSQQVIKHQQAKQQATEQAALDQSRVASELLRSREQNPNGPQMSESEVKSNNAKGRSGGHFAGGGSETIYDTGA